MMVKVLHFADAHIDIAQIGRPDPTTGLAWRVQDFLRSLDCIVDTAIEEKVDLVIFAGDAYRDRAPAPTYQREWRKRIMRLSKAGVQTILVVGNHDVSPSVGRATSMQEYDTLEIPNVKVIGKPTLLGPADLNGVQAQVIALPWINRSVFQSSMESQSEKRDDLNRNIEETLVRIVHGMIDQADPNLPLILTAHGSVATATFGAEREVMLGDDFIIPLTLVRDARLDYVALGHIHKNQDLNAGNHPPVIYPGSIERVNVGEVADEKYFILAEVDKGSTSVNWVKLPVRKMFVRHVNLSAKLGDESPEPDAITRILMDALPSGEDLRDAIVRLNIEAPKDWMALIDKAALIRYAADCKDFRIVVLPKVAARPLIAKGSGIESLSRDELLTLYLKNKNYPEADITKLVALAAQTLAEAQSPSTPKEAQ